MKYIRLMLLSALCLAFLGSCAGFGPRSPAHMGKKASTVVQGSRGDGTEGDFKPGPRFAEELKQKVALEYWALEGKEKEIPITLNAEVRASVEFLLNDARRFMVRSLGRSGKYKDMMVRVLKEKGLPPDLVYLVLIESGFRVNAVSPASAGGLWQFIPATGRRYGLRIDDFQDERMHPEKATLAAAEYLSELYKMFGSWNLAVAAYNCGEGKIDKGLKKFNADNFWDLAREEDFLRDETRKYVPRFLAAVIIAKEPEQYGLTNIEYDKPDELDEVVLPTATDLDLVARLCGIKESRVRELNPHLKRWCTPLFDQNYPLRLPKGAGEKFKAKYARLPAKDRLKVSVHTVQSGESLKKIATVYELSGKTLMRFNKLRSARLKKGQKIKLPVDPKVYQARIKDYQTRVAAERKKLEKTGRRVVYTIKPGDNPWLIAQRFDIYWKDIAVWNDIKDVKKMMPGDEIVLYLGDAPAPKKAQTAKAEEPKKKAAAKKMETAEKKKPAPPQKKDGIARPAAYTVREGDNLWRISLRFKVNPEKLRAVNGLKDNRLSIGQALKIAAAAGIDTARTKAAPTEPVAAKPTATQPKAEKPAPKVEEASLPGKKELKPAPAASKGTYVVQKDDTVWRLSLRFKVKPEALRAANNLKDNKIKPGQVLKLPGFKDASTKPAQTAALKKEPSKKPVAKSGKAAGKMGKAVSYTVRSGDTLWNISLRFKVKPEQIRSWNSLQGNKIKPGDVLTIKKNAG